MKTLLTLLAFLLATTVFAQQTNGFWEIPFFSSRATVKYKVLITKKLKPVTDDVKTLTYNNAEFGGEKAGAISFNFYQDKMYQGAAMFANITFEQALAKYNSWKAKLMQKYGKPKTDYYEFPYTARTYAEKEKALENREATVRAIWTTTDATTGKETGVILNLNAGKLVVVFIQDIAMANASRDGADASGQQDY